MPDVKGTVTADGVTFTYSEVKPGSGGPGPRGIDITGGGSSKVQFYPITPNPHSELGATYVNDAPAFYAAAAKHIVTGFSKPEEAKFTKLKESERPPTIAGPAWMALKKEKQKSEVDNYNKTQAEKVAADNKKALKTAVEAHFKGKKNSSFTWKSKSWKLP